MRSWRFPADRELTGLVEPPRARTVGALIAELAARRRDAEAIVFNGGRWSYTELDRASDEVARAFLAQHVGKGDHVAIFAGNRPDWMVTWLALNKIGATAVGVSTWSAPAELAYVLRHSDSRMLVYADGVGTRDLGASVRTCLAEAGWSQDGLSPQLPALRSVLRLPVDTTPGLTVPAEVVGELGKEVRGSDVALLLYTSGSTATPKGVQLVHRDMIENAYDIGEAQGLLPDDRYWLTLPLFWSAGSANTAMAVLTHGATVVLQEYFEAETAARLLREERCTHYFAFPNVTAAIHEALGDQLPLPAARSAVTPGQPEALRMLREMGFSELYHSYGTTEDYGFATINGPDDPPEHLLTSQGRALPGIEVVIGDIDTGEPLPPGERGEVLLRGHVTIGYYKDEGKNRDALDDQGFFHTGDLGVLHDDGRLEFLGRIRELIKTSGMNVSPAEVEATLLVDHAVAEAYVVGVPDEERGQVVVAFVRVAEGHSVDGLREHCARLLSSYKVPRRIVVREDFPMTGTGKVSKEALVRLASEDT
jgi:fatty-acyl-CoA synthase